MIFRLRYKQLGGHFHCRLFQAKGKNQTFEKNGDLVFDEQSWLEFCRRIYIAGIEVLREEDEKINSSFLKKEENISGNGVFLTTFPNQALSHPHRHYLSIPVLIIERALFSSILAHALQLVELVGLGLILDM